LWVLALVKPKTIKLIYPCFSAKYATFRSKSKDWLVRNQESEWSDMFTPNCCFSDLAL